MNRKISRPKPPPESSQAGTNKSESTPKPWQFRKGNAASAQGGKAKARSRRRTPKLLRDMRWVYDHIESDAGTEAQKELRAWLKSDRKGFFSYLVRLEARQMKEVAEGANEGLTTPTVPDEGQERALKAAEDWLRAHGTSGDNESR